MATSRTGTSKFLALRRQAIARGPLFCVHCRIALDPKAPKHTPVSIELDHIVAVSRGGTDTIDNVALSCHPCNRRKGAGPKPGAWTNRGETKREQARQRSIAHGVTCAFHQPIESTCPHSRDW